MAPCRGLSCSLTLSHGGGQKEPLGVCSKRATAQGALGWRHAQAQRCASHVGRVESVVGLDDEQGMWSTEAVHPCLRPPAVYMPPVLASSCIAYVLFLSWHSFSTSRILIMSNLTDLPLSCHPAPLLHRTTGCNASGDGGT